MEINMDLKRDGFSEEEYVDIKRCLETLLSVSKGSQPLDRDFGINLDGVVGYPVNVAKNKLSLEIIEKVEKYEPRVEIDSIEFEYDTDGLLCPRILFCRAKEG